MTKFILQLVLCIGISFIMSSINEYINCCHFFVPFVGGALAATVSNGIGIIWDYDH